MTNPSSEQDKEHTVQERDYSNFLTCRKSVPLEFKGLPGKQDLIAFP